MTKQTVAVADDQPQAPVRERSTTLIGVHSCGCITAALIERYSTPKDLRDFYRASADAGRDIRRVDSDSLNGNPDFLPSKCPHTPHGWEYQEPKKPDPIRYKRSISRRVSVVYVRVPGWETVGLRGGEVGKRDGKWWATEGWLRDDATAVDGKSPRGPAPVLGPFAKQREAAEALVPVAEKRGAELQAKWNR